LNKISQRPPRNHAVESQDNESRDNAERSDDGPAVPEDRRTQRERHKSPPDAMEGEKKDAGKKHGEAQRVRDCRRLGTQRLECPNRIALCVAAKRDFAQHDWYADDGDADEIYEDKRAPAILPGNVGELPDIPQADSRSRCRKNEPHVAAPSLASIGGVVAHVNPFLRNSCMPSNRCGIVANPRVYVNLAPTAGERKVLRMRHENV